ncbi:MAG TPA: hypothetical protein VK208_16005 [Pyrinomonadaceae bacterium]|jgi:hypothetical protein|nr:hypothetical protein [Pyrinomonadaceae bacterium]
MSAVLESLEHYSTGAGKGLASVPFTIARWVGDAFGCKHREMSRPFSRQGEAYRVCINCGARRRFDAQTWNSSGRHYYKPARSSDLQDIDMTALRRLPAGPFARARSGAAYSKR